MEQPEQFQQLTLLCQCGRLIELTTAGLLPFLLRPADRSVRCFGGLRERILERDRFRCTVCRTRSPLLVHHRDRNNQTKSLITLCIRCHVRIHRSVGLRHWLAGRLLTPWRELHPREPEQLRLVFNNRSTHQLQRGQPKARVIPTMPFFGSLAERRIRLRCRGIIVEQRSICAVMSCHYQLS